LTLLTSKANKTVKAKPFAAKKLVFEGKDLECPHPILSISKSVTDETEWDAAAVDRRTEFLATTILSRWPYPS